MTAKLRFVSLLLVLLAPTIVGASPVPPADSCSSDSPVTLLTEILAPVTQPSADLPEGLSPLEGSLDAACSGYTCDECAPCGGRVISCTNGEPACVCWNC